MPGVELVAIRCPDGCRGRDGKPFVIAEVDAQAVAANVYCGKHRGIVMWRRRVPTAV